MTREEIKPIFVGGAVVKDEREHVLGWGRRQSELIDQGFTKAELKALVKQEILTVIQARAGGVINVYVYSDAEELDKLREIQRKIVAREKAAKAAKEDA